jgi:hypothetical protein
MRLMDNERLIYVHASNFELITRVPLSGEWPTMVNVRCATPEPPWGTTLRSPDLVPIDDLVPMLRKTLDEREKVMAAIQRGIEGPYRFEGSEWAKVNPFGG